KLTAARPPAAGHGVPAPAGLEPCESRGVVVEAAGNSALPPIRRPVSPGGFDDPRLCLGAALACRAAGRSPRSRPWYSGADARLPPRRGALLPACAGRGLRHRGLSARQRRPAAARLPRGHTGLLTQAVVPDRVPTGRRKAPPRISTRKARLRP